MNLSLRSFARSAGCWKTQAQFDLATANTPRRQKIELKTRELALAQIAPRQWQRCLYLALNRKHQQNTTPLKSGMNPVRNGLGSVADAVFTRLCSSGGECYNPSRFPLRGLQDAFYGSALLNPCQRRYAGFGDVEGRLQEMAWREGVRLEASSMAWVRYKPFPSAPCAVACRARYTRYSPLR